MPSQELSTPKETGEAVQVKQEPVPGAPVTPQEVEERKKVRAVNYSKTQTTATGTEGGTKPGLSL